tara:strand:- start:1198 stop:2106 length:909 start_codon:yes stop_codon:yes gene_type:complete
MLKDKLRQILSTPFLLKRKENLRFFLTYHDIIDTMPVGYLQCTTKQDRFVQQINFLGKYFQFVGPEEVMSSSSSKNLICLTFDDGYLSMKDFVAPYLNRLKIPFVIFLNSKAVREDTLWLNKFNQLLVKDPQNEFVSQIMDNFSLQDKPTSSIIKTLVERFDFNRGISYIDDSPMNLFLNEMDIGKLVKDGAIIGSHSKSHYPLSKLNNDQLKQEIQEDKIALESMLDKEVKYLAFPFGKKNHYNASVIDVAKKAGFERAFTTNPNRFKKDEFLIPRISVLNESPKELNFFLSRAILKTYSL